MSRFYCQKIELKIAFEDLLGAKGLNPPFTWLDSVHQSYPQTRWSIFAEAPRHQCIVKDQAILFDGSYMLGEPLELLGQWHRSRSFVDNLSPAHLPWPGAIVALSYDFKNDLGLLDSKASQPNSPYPDVVAYFFDLWVVLDHSSGDVWVLGINHDFDPSFDSRCADFKQRLLTAVPEGSKTFASKANSLSPLREEYLKSVDQLLKGMRRGDFYQANLTRKYLAELNGSSRDVYRYLRKQSPSPFGALMEFGHQAILSASPERFVRIMGDRAWTCPIKGTRRRSQSSSEDAQIKQELLVSSKDRAELVMIVDLCRHDLAHFCLPGSVRVPDPCRLESHAGVHHLVATVEGQIKRPWKLEEVISSVFPGGSITGAPKLAAIKALDHLESASRGFYTGSLFLLDAGGDLDSSILIRTLLCDHKKISFQVGGGIVVESDPQAELQETYDKAQTLLATLGLRPEDFEKI